MAISKYLTIIAVLNIIPCFIRLLTTGDVPEAKNPAVLLQTLNWHKAQRFAGRTTDDY